MEMISQVHMTDQVTLPLPKHSFVALGLPRKAQCPCSGKKFYVFTEGPRTQPQPGMRNSHKWVRVLPTKIIARPQERQLHGVQMTCQLHKCSVQALSPFYKPAMQQSIQALRHKTKQQPNKCYNSTLCGNVRATVSWQAVGPLHIQFKPWTAYQCQRIKCPTNTFTKGQKERSMKEAFLQT